MSIDQGILGTLFNWHFLVLSSTRRLYKCRVPNMMLRILLTAALGISLCANDALAQSNSPWPRVREYGGAMPKNENLWIGAVDYPSGALRSGEQGNVIVAFDITADGRAKNCIVEASSGSPTLDRVPCRIIERKARFIPASDESGPVATKGRYSVAFWLPD
jgi:TonB family protein